MKIDWRIITDRLAYARGESEFIKKEILSKPKKLSPVLSRRRCFQACESGDAKIQRCCCSFTGVIGGAMNKSLKALKPSRIDLGDVLASPFDLLSRHHCLLIPLMINAAVSVIIEFGISVYTRAIFGNISFTPDSSIVPSPSTLLVYGIAIQVVPIFFP